MEKVVKCNGCGQYFMRAEKNIKYCPFCHTEYVEVDPVRSREGSQRASASNGVEEKTASSAEASDFAKASTDKSAAKKDKKGTTKTRKESFKIWKNS